MLSGITVHLGTHCRVEKGKKGAGGGGTIAIRCASWRSPTRFSRGPSSLASTAADFGTSAPLRVAAASAVAAGALAGVSRRVGDLTRGVGAGTCACEALRVSALAPNRRLFRSCNTALIH